MKKITIALAAALAVFGACQKTPALPAVQFDQTNYILPAEDGVTVKVVSDKALTADVEFTVSGTAVKGEDYKISVEDKVAFADAYEAAIVIEPLNNLEEKNIVLELKGAADGSFTLGGNAKTTVVITPKEKIYYSFATPEVRFRGTYELELKLIGAASGEKFRSEGELKVPFVIEGTAVEGTDFEIEGGEHYFVAADGSNVAKVKFTSMHETVPAEIPTLFVKIPEDATRFIAGVNSEAGLWFNNAPFFEDIVGKYAYSSYPLKDDPEADKSTFDALILDAGDTWSKNVPCKNTASDIIELKKENGVNKLTVSGTGDIFDYLTEAEVTRVEPCPYSWYFYYKPARPWENSVKLTLSKVNYDFAKTSADYKEGTIIINLSDDGEILDLVIPASSYDPVNGDYFKGVRSAYEGMVWTMYIDSGYWDCYYVFTKVSE